MARGGQPEGGAGSPYAAGGGGYQLEHSYGALALANLLLGRPMVGLGDELVVTGVAMQQIGTSSVDDLVVIGEGVGLKRTIWIACRRRPTIGKSSQPTVDLFSKYITAIDSNRAAYDSGEARLGLAVAGPQGPVALVAQLADVARMQPGPDEFFQAVNAPRAYDNAVRSRLVNVTEIVEVALSDLKKPTDAQTVRDTAWRVLKSLYVLQEDLEGDVAAGVTAVVSSLQEVVDTADRAESLRQRLMHIAAQSDVRAGHFTRAMLRATLRPFGPIGSSADFRRVSAQLQVLEDALLHRTDRSLPRLGGGAPVRVDRAVSRDALAAELRALPDGGILVVRGEPDVGKSVLMLDVIDGIRADGGSAIVLSLRDLSPDPLAFTTQIGMTPSALFSGAPSGPQSFLLVDGAEVVQERDDRVLASVLQAATSAGWPVILVTRNDAAGALAETVQRCGLAAPREYVVNALSEDESVSLHQAMPEIAPLGRDDRAAWLLRRLGILDLVLRVAVREGRLPSDVLSEADVARMVWASLIRNNERTDQGVAPDDLAAGALAVARGLLTGAQPSVPGGALARLRSEGILLRRDSTSAWQCTDEFASDVLRDFGLAALLIGEGLGALEAASAPRWTIRAARIYAQDRIGRAIPLGGADVLRAWNDVRKEFAQLGASHGARWTEIPWEALLSAGWSDQALAGISGDLLSDETLVAEVLRTLKLRFSTAGACDPSIGSPVIAWLIANRDFAGIFNSYADDHYRESVLSWLKGVARSEALGGDVAAFRPLRTSVRDALLSINPGYRSQDEWLECLGLLGSDANEELRQALRAFAQEKAHSLTALVESIDVAHSMSLVDVELLSELATAYYIEERDRSPWSSSYMDDGIRHHQPGGLREPHAAWYLGPFLFILRADFNRGLALIDAMLDHGARRRVESLDELSSRMEERTPDDVEPQGLDLDLLGLGGRLYVGDAHVWSWYRGSSVGPYPCMSALLALEGMMDAFVQAGASVRQVATRVLASATTLATVGLVFGFLVRHLDNVTDELDDFLSVPEIWHLEIGRVTSERGWGIRGRESEGLVGVPMRSWTPQMVCTQLVVRAMSSADPAAVDRLKMVGSALLEASGGDAAPAYIKQWAAALDSNAYSFKQTEEGVLIELDPGEEVTDVLSGERAHTDLLGEMYRLQNRYHLRSITPYRLDVAEMPSESELASDYATALELQSQLTEEPMDMLRSALAEVAATVIASADRGGNVPEGSLAWAIEVLVDSALNPYSGDFASESSAFPHGSDRTAALMLPISLPLVQEGDLRSKVTRAIVESATSGFGEVRRNAANGLGGLLQAGCAGGAVPCSTHAAAMDAIEAGARRVVMGPWSSSGRRQIEVIPGDLREALEDAPARDLVPSRLQPVIVAALDALVCAPCLREQVEAMLGPVLDAYARAVVEWSENDYGERHNWRPSLTSALLRADAHDGGSRVLEMARSLQSSARALASFLDDLQVVATYEPHTVDQMMAVWPSLTGLGLQRLAEVSDGSDRHGREALVKELVPSPNPSTYVGDFNETLDNARGHWFGLATISEMMPEWLQRAAHERWCVDQLVGFLQAQPVRDQVSPGLSWVRALVVQEDGSARTCGFLLVEWLTALRDSNVIDDESIANYRAIVDGLVLSGYDRARSLQSRDE